MVGAIVIILFVCVQVGLVGLTRYLGVPSELRELRKAAEYGDAQKLFELGDYYETHKEYAQLSAETFARAADQNHAEANFRLGRILLYGRDVKPNRAEAIERLQLGARLGSQNAANLLAIIHDAPMPDAERFQMLQAAADDDSLAAALLLGMHLQAGIGCERDELRATEYFKRASLGMLPQGTTCLADAYERGVGVKRDVEKALHLYEEAAENGEPEAMFQLGARLHYGLACNRDRNAAHMWLRRAALMGVERAQIFAADAKINISELLVEETAPIDAAPERKTQGKKGKTA